jgi:hypothetical protein
VWFALFAWIAIHLLLVAFFSIPEYQRCRERLIAASLRVQCGGVPAFAFLGVGFVQVLYGLAIGFVLRPFNAPLAQGVFIGVGSVFLLFTALCFGVVGL